jgi:hypothetical protein
MTQQPPNAQPHKQKMHPVSCVIFLLVALPFIGTIGYCLYVTLAAALPNIFNGGATLFITF